MGFIHLAVSIGDYNGEVICPASRRVRDGAVEEQKMAVPRTELLPIEIGHK